MRLTVPAGARPAGTITPPGNDGDGLAWTLYELPPRRDDSPLWRPFKLMLPPDTPARWRMRRSFSLVWNPLTLRLRKDRDRRSLEVENPALYERVELLLSLEYGPEWLVRVAGLTADEIQAEAARLRVQAAERRRAKAQAAKAAMRA